MLSISHPHITGIYNLSITPGSIVINNKTLQQINKLDKQMVPKIVAEFIAAYHTDKNTKKLFFIKQVGYNTKNDLAIALSEDYILKEGDLKMITASVKEKEESISQYKSGTGISECWLLLIIQGAGEASSYSMDSFALTEKSLFSKVYLMEAFTGVIKQLQ